MAKQPNILFITSDQQRADCFGRFESRGVRAPHVEALAERGTRFSACITPAPVCMPARASILTGMLPLTHGVYDNGVNLTPQMANDGFAARLGSAGYSTALIGKAHFATWETFAPTGSPECRFSSADYGADWFGPYCGFQHVELMTMGHLHRNRPPDRPPHGQHYERWFWSRAEGDTPYRLHATALPPDSGATNTWNSALPAAWHPSTWVANRSIEFLSRCSGSTPFCVWASFADPHQPFSPPEPWSRMYDPATVTLPRHRSLDLERRPWWHRATLEGEPQIDDPRLKEHRKKVSRLQPQTDAQLRHMTANYFGMISLVDHNVGRILSALADRGFADNTIVVYTTDHGEFLGDHGMYLKGPTLYESLLRVGLVIAGPGIPAARVVDAPVSTLDLTATFLEVAGVAPSELAQSRSLLPVVAGTADREAAYCEWDVLPVRCGVGLRLRTVRTRTHKLTLELDSGEGELYDLINDPDEMTNVFHDAEYSAVCQRLIDLIHARPGRILAERATPVGIY